MNAIDLEINLLSSKYQKTVNTSCNLMRHCKVLRTASKLIWWQLKQTKDVRYKDKGEKLIIEKIYLSGKCASFHPKYIGDMPIYIDTLTGVNFNRVPTQACLAVLFVPAGADVEKKCKKNLLMVGIKVFLLKEQSRTKIWCALKELLCAQSMQIIRDFSFDYS